jgi:hypothetical protein
MPQGSSHRVVAIVDEGSNPFELGVATELFGLRRPELPRPCACQLVERGEQRFDVVARASGLGTAANLRTMLRRHTGLSPSAYRRRFGT